jgi:hypothetical protein
MGLEGGVDGLLKDPDDPPLPPKDRPPDLARASASSGTAAVTTQKITAMAK